MTTLIKLAQSDVINSHMTPGDYTVALDQKTTLNNGDEVILKNTFIDTRTESGGKITIDDDNKNVSIEHGLYLFNHYMVNNTGASAATTTDFKIGYDNVLTGADIPQQPNGRNFVLVKHSGGVAGLRTMTSMKLQSALRGSPVNAGVLTFSYTDHNGKPASIGISFPSVDISGSGGTGFSTAKNLVIQYTNPGNKAFEGFVLTSPVKQQEAVNLEVNSQAVIGSFASQEGGQLIPVTYKYNFTLETGDYSPDTLAKKITDNLIGIQTTYNSTTDSFSPSANNNVVSGFPTKSSFLTSTKQLKQDADYGLGVNNDEVLFVSDDGECCLGIAPNSTSNYILGASQISLVYDSNLNKFVFQQINTDIQSSVTAGQSIVKYVKRGGDSEYFLANKHSGIWFKSLSNLFSDSLGFTPENICSSYVMTPTGATVTYTEGLATGVSVPTFSFTDGVNITGHLSSIDASITNNNTGIIRLILFS